MQKEPSQSFVIIGKIGAPYGVQGWHHVQSFTDPLENILKYKTWYLRQKHQWLPYQVLAGRQHAGSIVAHLEGITDRDVAAGLTLCDIGISRTEFKPLPHDEFYWADLEGATVKTVKGEIVGLLAYLYDNAGTDVMVVQSEGEPDRHIPFVMDDTVVSVSLDQHEVIVDWELAFHQGAPSKKSHKEPPEGQ